MHPGADVQTVPPAPFRHTDSGAIELRQGGGCVALIGIPFLLGSALLLLASAGVIRPKDASWNPGARTYFFVMGALFFTIAAGLIFARRALIIDVSTGRLIRRTSLVTTLWTEERAVGEFNAVLVAFQPGGSESPDRYPVRLRAIAGNDFTITSPTSFSPARQAAGFLAQLLHLPLADSTTEHEVVLTPDHSGDSLQQRLRSTAALGDRPAAPPQMRSRVTESARETVIVIPKRMSQMAPLIGGAGSAFALLVTVPVFWRLLSTDPTNAAHHLISFGAMLFFFGIFPVSSTALIFGLMRQKVKVTASPAGLTIKRRGPYRAPLETIPATDILDIDYSTSQGMLEAQASAIHQQTPRVAASLIRLVPNKGVVIKTRTSLVTFGEGLSADELRFLVWVLQKSLSQ